MFGDGDKHADIMFVARNPTKYEYKNDVPLIGADGQLFQKFLEWFGFNRDMVYITYAVKCKTPGHRVPSDKEIFECGTHLREELQIINPKIVVLLGTTAVRTFFNLAYKVNGLDIRTLSGKYFIHDGRVILIMNNPAVGLKYVSERYAMYYNFVTLLKLYRIIRPWHTTILNI
jgi:DNA polymerase